MQQRSADEIARLVEDVVGMPLHRHLGLRRIGNGPGWSELTFEAGTAAQTNLGTVHGGALSLLLEPAALVALIPLLAAGEFAATVDVQVSFPRAPRPGGNVLLKGKVLRRGRTMAFCQAEAWSENQLCASARMTKAIIAVQS